MTSVLAVGSHPSSRTVAIAGLSRR